MQDLITEIKIKLNTIDAFEPYLKKIALESKKPIINKPISQTRIELFEKKFDINLPEEFKQFYITITNGNNDSAGPELGLYTIEQIEQKIDRKNIRGHFPLKKAWHGHSNEITIPKDRVLPGTIPISSFGGGKETFLVIDGRLAGTVWADDRQYVSGDSAIYPLTGMSSRFKDLPKLSFLQWYLDWLESCFERVNSYQDRKSQALSQISGEMAVLKLKGLHLTYLPSLPKLLPNLISVDLSGNQLKSLKGFPTELPKLQHLNLQKCGLTKLESFPQNLANLLHLSLGDLNINNLIGLPPSFPKLQTFWAAGSQLETLQGFPQNVPELQGLDFSHTYLKNLDYLPSLLPNLEILELRGCELESLQGLPSNLPKLRILDLRKAIIKTPESIPDWVKPFIKT